MCSNTSSGGFFCSHQAIPALTAIKAMPKSRGTNHIIKVNKAASASSAMETPLATSVIRFFTVNS